MSAPNHNNQSHSSARTGNQHHEQENNSKSNNQEKQQKTTTEGMQITRFFICDLLIFIYLNLSHFAIDKTLTVNETNQEIEEKNLPFEEQPIAIGKREQKPDSLEENQNEVSETVK